MLEHCNKQKLQQVVISLIRNSFTLLIIESDNNLAKTTDLVGSYIIVQFQVSGAFLSKVDVVVWNFSLSDNSV